MKNMFFQTRKYEEHVFFRQEDMKNMFFRQEDMKIMFFHT